MPAAWNELQPDVWTPILESLGTSLGRASAASSTWREVVQASNYSVFRPLACVIGAPAPGQVPHYATQQAEVASNRRAQTSPINWRELAKAVSDPAQVRSRWQKVDLRGDAISHRHAVAVCGAPSEVGTQAALLFGGNTSRTVAGRWKNSDELLLAKLPQALGGACEMSCLGKAEGISSVKPWPDGRWGASLTALSSACYLVGGWSRDGDASHTWALRFREACVHWSRVESPTLPPATAFHTATALEDGKRIALTGGLGSGGSQKGLWYFDEGTESWHQVSSEGPSLAGHAAASIDDRLILFGGVTRSSSFGGDDQFSSAISIFDVRRDAWDLNSAIEGGGPMSRRNPTYARLGQHLIISGGCDEGSSRTLDDTWAFNAARSNWKKLPCQAAPAVEGHKSIVSGFDLFTFGGHSAPGYPSHSMSVHTLSFDLGEKSLEAQSASPDMSHEHGNGAADPESSDSTSDDEDFALVELPDGRLVPVSLVRALLRRHSRMQQRQTDAAEEPRGSQGYPAN
eukprot:TRINITY_DN29844_c0_g1_i1.p1 TRINITY_DN29844_c0_g1~~TRINITY_DN29844_c0_g1_i1.p1  ORF type:complete len:515 (-),score=83.81 TRINITY_DN29844_c0_g1_i1:612-2156(-)